MTARSTPVPGAKPRKVGAMILALLALAGCRSESSPDRPRAHAGPPSSQAAVPRQDFDWLSYQAGVLACSAEFVGCGAKRLALSPPYTEAELDRVIELAKREAEKNGIPMMVEKDLLQTGLFSPDLARGKAVILFAYDHDVLCEYRVLKAFRAQAERGGRLASIELDLARRFGRLLSYSEKTVQRLLADADREEE